MKDILPSRMKQCKAEVNQLAQRAYERGGFLGQKLRVGERYFGNNAAPTVVLEDEMGQVFGVISKQQSLDWVVGEEVIIRQAKGYDGNIKTMVERVAIENN
jgi:hypothetical protein